jgi:hypothetical protein
MKRCESCIHKEPILKDNGVVDLYNYCKKYNYMLRGKYIPDWIDFNFLNNICDSYEGVTNGKS